MKKAVYYVLCLMLLCGLMGCGNTEGGSYAGFEKKEFIVVEENDTHGGFHGDGIYYLVLDCSENREEALQLVKTWKTLPLSEDLHTVLYGSDTYGSLIARETNIPEITNGYYYFCDRHSESSDASDDSQLLGRASYNFTVAIYDSDTDKLYYVEFDT